MATEDIQKLVVLLEARTAAFEKQMAKASASANRSAKQIETRFQRMQTGLASSFSKVGSALGAIGVSFAVGSLVSKFKEITEAADDLVDTAKRIDFPVERLKAFQNVVALNGGSVEQATASLDKFQQNIATAATKGGDLAKVLEANGIALRDANGQMRPITDLLDDYILLMGRAASATDKNKLATIAFGKANSEIAGAVGNGAKSVAELNAEVERLGPNFAAQQQALADANDQIDIFLRNIGEKLTIAAAAGVEALTEYNTKITELGAVMNDFINNPSVKTFIDMLFGKDSAEAAGIGDAAESVSEAAGILKQEIDETTAEIAAYEEAIRKAEEAGDTFTIDSMQARLAELRADLAQTTAELNTYGDAYDRSLRRSADTYMSFLERRASGDTFEPAPGVTAPPAAPDASPAVLPVKVVEDETDDGATSSATKAAARSVTDLSTAVRRAIGAWETRGMTPTQAYAATGAAGEIGRYQIMRANIGPWSKEALDYSITPEAFRASPEIQDQIAQYKVNQYVQKYGVEGAIRAWNSGSPTGTTTAGYVPGVMGMLQGGAGFEDINAASDGIAQLEDRSAELIDRFAELRDASESFLNTFVDGLLDGKSAVESLGEALEQLGRQLISSGINMLVGSIFPTPAAGAGLFSGIVGRATGGPINPGQVYKVHKDELIVPRGPGTVIPVGAAKSANGGGTSLSYSPSIVIQGNADANAIQMMRDRMLIDIEQRLPSMVRRAHSNRML